MGRYRASVVPETDERRKGFLFSQDVQKLLLCGRTKALRVISDLNKELEEKGYLTQRGRVSRKYFFERFYG